jgi:hypothetical protein
VSSPGRLPGPAQRHNNVAIFSAVEEVVASSSITTKVDADNIILDQSRGIDRSVFLLGGFALENAIKAFLVYENPQWVSNGRLSRNLKSHSLTALQSKSELVPYKKRHVSILKAFEGGLDSWFRYRWRPSRSFFCSLCRRPGQVADIRGRRDRAPRSDLPLLSIRRFL